MSRPDTTLRRVDAAAISRLDQAPLFDLSDKVALVTGAGGGLGSWLAAGLAAAGGRVGAERPRVSLDEIAETLGAAELNTTAIPADLLEPDAPDQLIAALSNVTAASTSW